MTETVTNVEIPTHVVQDNMISSNAKGILAYIISLPDGSSVSVERLSDELLEGRRLVGRALRELRESGYVALKTRKMHQGSIRSYYVVNV